MPICRIFNSKGTELTHFRTEDFPNQRRIVVGRSSKCDVSLKHLAENNISREHFNLTRSLGGDEWKIHDTSRAGIVLDCRKVPEADLTNGSVLRFGQLFFCFGDRAVPSPFFLSWNSAGGVEEYARLWPGVNSVGASHDNYVMVREGSVSRFHAKIEVNGERILLSNLSSMVESQVNGTDVIGARDIRPGDDIVLADVSVRLGRADAMSVPVADILSESALQRQNQKSETSRNLRPTIVVILLLIIIGCFAIALFYGVRLLR